MRDDYAWDGSGESDAFVDEMESMLRHFDRRPTVRPMRAHPVVAVATPPMNPRRRLQLAFWVAAAAAVMLTLLVARHLTGRHAAAEPLPPVASMRDASDGAASPAQWTAMSKKPYAEPTRGESEKPSASALDPNLHRRASKRSRRDEPTLSAEAGHEEKASRRILAEMARYWPRIEACVSAGREEYPDREGYFWLSFAVSADGRVTNVATIPRGNTRAPDVTGCVVAEVETWTFASDDTIPPGGHPIRTPIFLHEEAQRRGER